MALNNLTGQNIQDTYQKVVQTDGTNLADGTGSLLPISFNGNDVIISGSLTAHQYIVSSSVTNITIATLSGSTTFGDSTDDTHIFTGNITASNNISASGIVYGTTGSFSHLQGNSPITVGDSITFQQNITASNNIKAIGTITATTVEIDGTVTATSFVGNFKGNLTKEGLSNILTLPDTTDTLVGRATNDTFTGLKTFSSAITSSIISASGNIIGSTSYFSQTIITLNSTDLAAESSPFLIKIADNNGQDEKLQVNPEGVLRFGALTTLPTAVTGGLVYYASDFYMGIS
jgi:hypothetical protein